VTGDLIASLIVTKSEKLPFFAETDTVAEEETAAVRG
jgi:hypothetical protein